jgi:hypothetical protein
MTSLSISTVPRRSRRSFSSSSSSQYPFYFFTAPTSSGSSLLTRPPTLGRWPKPASGTSAKNTFRNITTTRLIPLHLFFELDLRCLFTASHIWHLLASSDTFLLCHSPSSRSALKFFTFSRGDYVLTTASTWANWSARLGGLQRVPRHSSTGFSPPVVASAGHTPPEKLTRYRAHRFPEITQIVERVLKVLMALLLPATLLSRVYLLTNGRPEWLAELKDATMQLDAR